MATIACLIRKCEYTTQYVNPVLAAALITERKLSKAQLMLVKHQLELKSETSKCILMVNRRLAIFQAKMELLWEVTKPSGVDRIIQLLEYCEDRFKKNLTQHAGVTLKAKTEDNVFAAIKGLAIREENVMVARVVLHIIKKGWNELINAHRARLRGQTGVCRLHKNVLTVKLM